MKKEVVIVGLDGVLAFIENRLKHLYQEDGSQDWKRFYENVIDDTPALPLIQHIAYLHKMGKEIVIITGRSAITKNDTLEWLKMWDIDYDALWMRPEDDFTPAPKFKKSILDQHYSDRIISHVYESDHHIDVCKMLMSINISCTQVSRNLGNGESREEIESRSIKHSCGHAAICRFHGDDSHDWDNITARVASETCSVCAKSNASLGRENKAAVARIHAEQMGLSPLEGSVKQIEWAENIRQLSLESIKKVSEWMSINGSLAMEEDPDHWDSLKSCVKSVADFLGEQTDAKWWIDHAKNVRGDLSSGRSLVSNVAEEMGYW
jgi:hypothetical protein